jgi:hypothetical protein
VHTIDAETWYPHCLGDCAADEIAQARQSKRGYLRPVWCVIRTNRNIEGFVRNHLQRLDRCGSWRCWCERDWAFLKTRKRKFILAEEIVILVVGGIYG